MPIRKVIRERHFGEQEHVHFNAYLYTVVVQQQITTIKQMKQQSKERTKKKREKSLWKLKNYSWNSLISFSST